MHKNTLFYSNAFILGARSVKIRLKYERIIFSSLSSRLPVSVQMYRIKLNSNARSILPKLSTPCDYDVGQSERPLTTANQLPGIDIITAIIQAMWTASYRVMH